MELYLLRHGAAADDSPTGRDADRELTEPGRQKLRNLLTAVANGGIVPEVIISSPYVRAWQTAEMAKEILGCKQDIQLSDALVPESDPEEVWREIRTLHSGVPSLLLASHEPLMGRCASYLLGYPDLLIDFKKGALFHIEMQQFGMHPRGLLKWMMIPRLARA